MKLLRDGDPTPLCKCGRPCWVTESDGVKHHAMFCEWCMSVHLLYVAVFLSGMLTGIVLYHYLVGG